MASVVAVAVAVAGSVAVMTRGGGDGISSGGVIGSAWARSLAHPAIASASQANATT